MTPTALSSRSAENFSHSKKLGNRRITGKEQYYTPTDLAEQLISEVLKFVPDLASRKIMEPAGGTGSFIKAAAKAGAKDFLSFDIEPKHVNVTKANFLQAKLSGENAVTISNPPFGRNNALSIPFFNKAADHSEFICFIVPRSWRKWSVINRLDRRFHLVADRDIQIDYEDEAGQKLSVKNNLATCFQIWQRSENLRPIFKVADKGIIEKCDFANADVALTIFGFSCGKVLTQFDRKPNSTKMFLKLHHPEALIALQNVDFSKFYKNTAYTQALSLPEINYLLNERILGNPHLIEMVD
jgi:predicted RNA methylase